MYKNGCDHVRGEKEKGIIRKVVKQQKSELLTETDARCWYRCPPMITTRLVIGGSKLEESHLMAM